ncbi:MAG TPA: hypothetical protein VF064_07065 [Pyrinomonadaceae bacterium]
MAVVLLAVGLVLAGLAYSFYSEHTRAGNVARFYRTHADEMPTSGSREERIAGELRSADRNRNLAMLSGAGGLLLCAGGAALFMLSRRVEAVEVSPPGGTYEDPAAQSEAIDRWASVALTRPVTVQYRRLHTVLLASVLAFFTGMSLLMVVANGLTGVTVLLLILNGLLLVALSYLARRARRRAASRFDLSGVTRGDQRLLSWGEFKGVDYLMAIKPRSGREYLWRVELRFVGGVAWIIPRRVVNLPEVIELVGTLPGTHRKRRA